MPPVSLRKKMTAGIWPHAKTPHLISGDIFAYTLGYTLTKNTIKRYQTNTAALLRISYREFFARRHVYVRAYKNTLPNLLTALFGEPPCKLPGGSPKKGG